MEQASSQQHPTQRTRNERSLEAQTPIEYDRQRWNANRKKTNKTMHLLNF